MYFVVHLKNSFYDVVVPRDWIKGIDDHWEKFINNSLNKNQLFLCYFNANALDKDGRPQSNVTPNFRAMANFPGEGCYEVNLIRFKSESLFTFLFHYLQIPL